MIRGFSLVQFLDRPVVLNRLLLNLQGIHKVKLKPAQGEQAKTQSIVVSLNKLLLEQGLGSRLDIHCTPSWERPGPGGDQVMLLVFYHLIV